jgi:hypothetical protein
MVSDNVFSPDKQTLPSKVTKRPALNPKPDNVIMPLARMEPKGLWIRGGAGCDSGQLQARLEPAAQCGGAQGQALSTDSATRREQKG